MKAHSWKRIPEIVAEGIRQALALDGYAAVQIETYLAAAGEPEFTKTHGRRSVGGLNQAVFVLQVVDKVLDERQLFQARWSRAINKDLCHPAGFVGRDYGYPWEFFKEDMKRFGIIDPGDEDNIGVVNKLENKILYFPQRQQ